MSPRKPKKHAPAGFNRRDWIGALHSPPSEIPLGGPIQLWDVLVALRYQRAETHAWLDRMAEAMKHHVDMLKALREEHARTERARQLATEESADPAVRAARTK